MLKFTVEEDALEGIKKRFNIRLSRHMRTAMEDMRDELSSWLSTEQQKGTNGGWEPLSAAYEERKERDFPGEPILSRTGQMMAGYMNSIQVYPKEYTIAINYPGAEGSQMNLRARAHQEGRSKLPARPFPVDEQGREDLENIAIRHFRRALSKATKGD